MNVVELKSVTKRFGRTVALNGVSTVIPRGSVVGLIGRNGCGKTTLLRHAAGLLVADAGDCLTLGVPSPGLEAEQLARMGVVHQHDPLLPFMRVGQLGREAPGRSSERAARDPLGPRPRCERSRRRERTPEALREGDGSELRVAK